MNVMKDEANSDYILDRVDFIDIHWLWKRYIDKKTGYAKAATKNKRGVRCKTVTAHNLSYETFVGPIPMDKEIGHAKSCPYRHCISPACLSAMTHSQNLLMRA